MKLRARAVAVLMGLAGCLPASAWAQAVAPQEDPPTGSCDPVNGLSFVCGLDKPEDLVRVPSTRWLIASGVDPAASLRLIDTDARTSVPLYTAAADQVRPDTARYPGCPAAPAATGFAPHGLALRPGSQPETYTLYAVSHLAVEGVQVFRVEAGSDRPSIAWVGCVPFPAGMTGNAVTAFSDGTILATVRGSITAEGPPKSRSGITMGAVVSWAPGEAGFHQVRGTEMYGTNGIEISRDESEFFVVSTDTGAVSVFSRANPGPPLRQSTAPLTSLDNLHWTDGRLLAAGKMADEPACGGTRQQVIDRGQAIHDCIRGYAAVELNPTTMTWSVVAYGEPNPVFDGVATAIPVGGTLWLSSFLNDRVAYRPLPGASGQ